MLSVQKQLCYKSNILPERNQCWLKVTILKCKWMRKCIDILVVIFCICWSLLRLSFISSYRRLLLKSRLGNTHMNAMIFALFLWSIIYLLIYVGDTVIMCTGSFWNMCHHWEIFLNWWMNGHCWSLVLFIRKVLNMQLESFVGISM